MDLHRFAVVVVSASMLAASVSHISAPATQAAIFTVIPADSNLDPQDTFEAGQDVYAYVTSNLAAGRVCLDGYSSGESSCTDIPPFAADFFPIVSHGVLTTGTHHLTGFPTDPNDHSATITSAEFQVVPCVTVCNHALDAEMAAQYKARAEAMVDGTEWSCATAEHWEGTSTELVGARTIVNDVNGGNSDSENYGIIAGNTMTFVQGFLGAAGIESPSEEVALALLKEVSCATKTAYKSIVADPPNADYVTTDTPTPLSLPTYPDAPYQAFVDSFNTVYAVNAATLRAYERYLGAEVDGSDPGVHHQMANVSLLAGQTSGDMLDLATRLRAYVATLTLDADARSVMTTADRDAIAAIQDRVRASGFTDDEKAQLATLGFSDLQIEAFRQSDFVDLDVADAKLDTPASTILTGLADDLVANASFWDEFSAASAVVAGNTDSAPIASFTALPAVGSAPLDVMFTGTSTDPDSDPLTSAWDFGDGSTGTGGSADHQYTVAGVYTATLTASDGTLSSQASHTVVVSAPDQAPTAEFSISPGAGPRDVTLTSTSTDPDGDPLTTSWDFGDGSSNGSGSPIDHTYAATGTYTVALTVSDGFLSNQASDTVTVPQANRAPVAGFTLSPLPAFAGTAETFANTSTDPDGDALSSSWDFGDGGTSTTTSPVHTYATGDAFYTVTLTVSDGTLTSTTEYGLNIGTPNAPPVAADDYLAAGGAVVTSTLNVLTNDTDPDGNLPLGVTSWTQGAHGSVSCPGDGVCGYTPAHLYAGTDTFTYTVMDSRYAATVGTVYVVVDPIANRAPAANPDGAYSKDGAAVTIPVLQNDSDPDGDPVAFTGVLSESHGVADCDSQGTCAFTPTAGFIGDAGFTYGIDDGHGLTASSLVTVAVLATGVAFASGDLFLGVDSSNYRVNRSGSLLDALVPSGTGFASGMCFDAGGSLYTTNFNGRLFKYDNRGVLVSDDWTGAALDGTSAESCVFDAAGNLYVGSADAPLGLGFLHEFDASGNLIGSWSPSASRGNDWIDLAPDQCTMYYTSESTYIGRFDTCTGTQLPDFASDLPGPCFANRILPGGGVIVACESAILRLSSAGEEVQRYDPQRYPETSESYFAINIDPDGTSFWTIGRQARTISHVDLASGDTIDQFPVPVTVSSWISSGLATASGLAVFGELRIAQNHPPVGNPDSYSGPQDTAMTVDAAGGVLANDTDADGNTLTATEVAGPSHGTVVLAEDGSFVYTPNAGYVGPDSFAYDLADGAATVGPVAVSITVTHVNHPPTLGLVTDQSIPELVLFDLTVNGADPDGDSPLVYSVPTGPSGLTVEPVSGVLAWTPSEAQGPGVYPLTIRVTDSGGLFAEGSFTITVTEVNRSPLLAAIAERTVYPGDAVSFTAAATDPDLPANILGYSLVSGPAGATVNSTTGAFAWTASGTLGDYPATIGVSDSAGGDDQGSFTIHVVRDTTSLSIGNDTASQYSDRATISASLKVGSTPVVGATVAISLGTTSISATTNGSGVASGTFSIVGPAGSLPIAAAFAGTASKAPSTASGAFTVNREDSTIVYSGDNIGLAGATLHLSAAFTDSAAVGFLGPNPETRAGATIGDITRAKVAFTIYNAATCLSGSPIATLSASVIDTATVGDGIGTAALAWSSPSEGTFCIVPSLVGDDGIGLNDYYSAPEAEAAGLAVFIDTAGKVTGGGWITLGDGCANFGFNAASNGNKVKGSLVFVERTTYRGTAALLIVKSNAIDSLRVTGTTLPIHAALSGKASFKFISSADGSTLFESGNATFTAIVVDTDSKAGSEDTFGIRVIDKTGAVLVDVALTMLGGGNIVAHLK
ncbi:MAG: Ig-like domain-containing protein [Aeromicrobium sp.]